MTDLEFINKLIIKTQNDYKLWTEEGNQEFSCAFGQDTNKRLVFVYSLTEDEDESGSKIPDSFFIFFKAPNGEFYKQIFVHNYDITENPLVGAFMSLYKAILANAQKQFDEDCQTFF